MLMPRIIWAFFSTLNIKYFDLETNDFLWAQMIINEISKRPRTSFSDEENFVFKRMWDARDKHRFLFSFSAVNKRVSRRRRSACVTRTGHKMT